MARMIIKAGEEFTLKLSRMAEHTEEVAKKAIYAGAKVVADKIKSNLKALPTESFRYLGDGEKFSGVPEQQKQDLIDGFGISPIQRDEAGWNAKLGFDGYGSFPTRKYPNGLPNQLLARAIESGSSVRQKKPFVRPAVNVTKKKAEAEMVRAGEEELKKIYDGG